MKDVPCTIWLCSRDTREECLERSLFGDTAASDRWLSPCSEGHLAFLLDFERDELMGVFVAQSGMAAEKEPSAWGGQYPCQVRVSPVGPTVALPNASKILRSCGVPLRRLRRGGTVPRGFNFAREVSVALQHAFLDAGS